MSIAQQHRVEENVNKKPSFIEILTDPYLHILLWCLRRTIPKQQIFWHCAPPAEDEPCIFVCNHEHAYGPVAMCTGFPYKFRPWVDGAMSNVITARRHLQKTLIRAKSWPARVAAFLLSYFMVLPSMEALRELKAIHVHRDKRVVKTINTSVDSLIKGENNVIFPEYQELPYSDIIGDFHLGFIHVAKQYYLRSGKQLAFFPVFLRREGRESGEIHIGAPISFDPSIASQYQKEQIGKYLRDEIINMSKKVL